MKLEELLNKLIQIGWKPRGEKLNGMNFEHEKWNKRFVFGGEDKSGTAEYNEYSLRDLVSMESGLWQFVCKNNLTTYCSKCNIKLESNNDKIKGDIWYEEEYTYRLMLSSIQENIEPFLLYNILLPTE